MSVLSRRTRIAAAVLVPLCAACSPAKTVPEPGTTTPTVTAADLQNPGEPIEQVLQRKAPGVIVTRVGNEIAVQIRGTSSYTGANTPPLYVLNGLQFRPGPSGLLSGINPMDIETIKVLRGTDAALYGIDGANGVIAISTKRGGKP
jgi:TonB-dependent SusC/RagA subfamily outer membrane receptor